MRIELQDYIDDYLQGRMSDEELHAFEKAVEGDKELQEQLAFTEDVRHVMRSRNEKLSKMQEWEYYQTQKDVIKGASSMKLTKGLRITYWFSGIVATFIIVVFVFTTYKLPIRGAEEPQMVESTLNEKDYVKMLARIENDEEDIKFKIKLLARDLDTRGEEQESVIVKLKKLYDDLQYLHWERVQALIELKRHEEAMILLDEILHSESKYKEQADSLRHSLQQ